MPLSSRASPPWFGGHLFKPWEPRTLSAALPLTSRRGSRRLLAAQRGRGAAVARLLQAGADASARVPRGRETALGLAAYSGDLAAAQRLVAAGADVVSVASTGFRVLGYQKPYLTPCTCWAARLVESSSDCHFPACGCPRADASAYSSR